VLIGMTALVLSLLVSAAIAMAAGSENAAFVVKLDKGCTWWSGDTAEDSALVAKGSVRYVQVRNGGWTLSCIGDIVIGLPLGRAVILNSTADDPEGTCSTPFGFTFDWQIIFSPSGTSSINCHGDLTP